MNGWAIDGVREDGDGEGWRRGGYGDVVYGKRACRFEEGDCNG